MRTILSAPAWPYANGPRHIGHVSGFALPCDMFSRYQRMAGNRVLMVSGTDEHGTPIQVQADAEGVTARELAELTAIPLPSMYRYIALLRDTGLLIGDDRGAYHLSPRFVSPAS